MSNDFLLRNLTAADLPIFFAQQADPDAIYMAAFTAKDPTDQAAFMAHWQKIQSDDTIMIQTIVVDGQVAGYVLSYETDGKPEVSYWLGRVYWGQGLATRALVAFLAQVNQTRPIFARVAKDNFRSLRVLEKCGFKIVGQDTGYAHARGAEIAEWLLECVTAAPLMLRMPESALPHAERTMLTATETGDLGEMHFFQPPDTFALTPASRIAIQTIGRYRHLLTGNGLDWGSGVGCLAVAAARIATVDRVIGLELFPHNVAAAYHNAWLNGVADKTTFFLSDSYLPFALAERAALDALRGKIDFILANPPASEGDDGFTYRRLVLQGAREFLTPGGILILNISYQYGAQRIERLGQIIPGFTYSGVLASSDWVPFDLRRPDLLHCLELYAVEEQCGGLAYAFPAATEAQGYMNAQMALKVFQQTGQSPLTQWQTHLFQFIGE